MPGEEESGLGMTMTLRYPGYGGKMTCPAIRRYV